MTKEERQQLLIEKLSTMKSFDAQYKENGIFYVGGIDEAGRGPLAGPVVAACVVLDDSFDVIGIDDSKKLSEKKREEFFEKITSKALAYGVGILDNNVIDDINILQATKQAMRDAVSQAQKMLLKEKNHEIDHLLIDAVKIENLEITQSAIIKGDTKSLSIAAASIIAKVTRDRIMMEYHQEYPMYGFDSNKGYGTKVHYQGIDQHGITPIHRRTFLKNL